MTIKSLVERERRHLWRAEMAAGALLAAAVTLVLLASGAAILGKARWLDAAARVACLRCGSSLLAGIVIPLAADA